LKLLPFQISNKELQEWEIQMKKKNISLATKCNISLNFPHLDFPSSIGGKVGISKENISNTYPII